jgi:hypothetical protein
MGIVLLAAMAAILAPICSASASPYYANYKWHLERRTPVRFANYKWHLERRTPVRFPICHTVREPIALRHGYLIYLPHEICR